MLYIYIIYYFIKIISYIKNYYIFFRERYNLIKKIGKIFCLIEYKGIKIQDYFLENIEKENNKSIFLRKICKNFTINNSDEEIEIINIINEFRKKMI